MAEHGQPRFKSTTHMQPETRTARIARTGVPARQALDEAMAKGEELQRAHQAMQGAEVNADQVIAGDTEARALYRRQQADKHVRRIFGIK